MNEDCIYIHYGNEQFDINRFMPIANKPYPWVKPESYTGFWGSPIDSDNTWKDFCFANNFRFACSNKSFMFKIDKNATILSISRNKDLSRLISEHLLDTRNCGRLECLLSDLYCIDFEECLHRGYDAIDVRINTHEIYTGLYGWDCDSILVLNPNCVINCSSSIESEDQHGKY